MTAKLSLLNRRLVIEATAADAKTLFREIGLMAEIFEVDDRVDFVARPLGCPAGMMQSLIVYQATPRDPLVLAPGWLLQRLCSAWWPHGFRRDARCPFIR